MENVISDIERHYGAPEAYRHWFWEVRADREAESERMRPDAPKPVVSADGFSFRIDYGTLDGPIDPGDA